MKSFVFRVIVIILVCFAILTAAYSASLKYLSHAFTPVSGDFFCETQNIEKVEALNFNGAPAVCVFGTYYPDDDMNNAKHSFVKLYNKSGNILFSAGIPHNDGEYILNEIAPASCGLALSFEIRNDRHSFGRIYRFDSAGNSLDYIDLTPSESDILTSGAIFCISSDGKEEHYVGLGNKSAVVFSGSGEEICYANYEDGFTPSSAVYAKNYSFISGYVSDDDTQKASVCIYKKIPEKAEQSLVSVNNVTVNNGSNTLSRADSVRLSIDSGKIYLSGRYFDCDAYLDYLQRENISVQDNITTIAEKSFLKKSPLFLTAFSDSSFAESPYPSFFCATMTTNGALLPGSIKTFETGDKSSVANLSVYRDFSSETGSFFAFTAESDNESSDSDTIKFKPAVLNSSDVLKSDEICSPVSMKTYLLALPDMQNKTISIFSYSSANGGLHYKANIFNSFDSYRNHIEKLNIISSYFNKLNESLSMLPIILAFSVMAITARYKYYLIRSGK